MSKNQIALFEDELAKMAEAEASEARSSASSSYLGTKNGVLTYQGNPLPDNEIECVVISAPTERMYYANRYDPDNPEGPACFALAPHVPGMKPSPASVNVQHEECATCPQNEWGSASQGKGKACKETRRVMIVPLDSLESEDKIASCEVAAVRPPVTSLKNYSTYVQGVAATTKRPLAGVITKIKLVPDAKTQFKMLFETVSLVEDMGIIKALMNRGARELENALAATSESHGEGEGAEKVAPSDKF